MSDEKKPTYANFPERDLKVVIGGHINASTRKTLTRLSIGAYEMSFIQQERGKLSGDAVKTALHTLFRGLGMAIASEESREFSAVWTAQNAEHRYQIWVTTPFELTQAAHLLWVKYQELGGQGKVGVSFRLATAFSADDVVGTIKAAQTRAVVLEAGAPFVLTGNPPPRFQKKKTTSAPESVPAATAPAASGSETGAPPAP